MTTRIYDSALQLIGRTPLVRLKRLSGHVGAEVCAKLESQNPGGSVKDRPALAMVEQEERAGRLLPGATLVEATSGNTGISLAMIAAVRGYQCIIVMPEDMSLARRNILASYGATVVLTSAEDGMAGAVEQALAAAHHALERHVEEVLLTLAVDGEQVTRRVVVAAVHHAEVVAHRVGEPYGTLVLAVAVTVIEVDRPNRQQRRQQRPVADGDGVGKQLVVGHHDA